MRTRFSPTTGRDSRMGWAKPDARQGGPALELGDDQIESVVNLVCHASHDARVHLKPDMLEPQISRVVRKSMRRAKEELGIAHVQIRGEVELDDMSNNDPSILGRIDITLEFRHQFGIEDAYVAVECKKVAARNTDLNGRYVTQGVDRFARGQYSKHHAWGFLLGYVITLPSNDVVQYIDGLICDTYGSHARLRPAVAHPLALAVFQSELSQGDRHTIRLMHIFVDMRTAGT